MSKPQPLEVKTHPADAAKKRDPITRWKSLQPLAECWNCLEIVCFVTPAGAISQNGKDNNNEDRDEDYDDQHLDGGKQKAAQSDDGAE